MTPGLRARRSAFVLLAAAAALAAVAAPGAQAQTRSPECIAFNVNCPPETPETPETPVGAGSGSDAPPPAETPEPAGAAVPPTTAAAGGAGAPHERLLRDLAPIVRANARELFRRKPLSDFVDAAGSRLVIPDAFARSEVGVERARDLVETLATELELALAADPALRIAFEVHTSAEPIARRTLRPNAHCAPPQTTLDLSRCRKIALQKLLREAGLDESRWTVVARGEAAAACRAGADCDDEGMRADRKLVLRLSEGD